MMIGHVLFTTCLCGGFIGCAYKLYKSSKKYEVLAQAAPQPQTFVQPVMVQPMMMQQPQQFVNQPMMAQPFNAMPMGGVMGQQYPQFAPVGSAVRPQ